MSKVVQVANMMANNPETTAADVAKKFNRKRRAQSISQR